MPYQRPGSPEDARRLRRFGIELRRCRMYAGLSQVRLAEASGVSQSTISRLERGKASSAAMFKLVLLGDAVLLEAVPRAVMGMRAEREREAVAHRVTDAYELEHGSRRGLAPFEPRDRRLRDARALRECDLAESGVEPAPTKLRPEAPK